MRVIAGGGDKRRERGLLGLGVLSWRAGIGELGSRSYTLKIHIPVIPDGWPDLIGPQIRDPDAQRVLRQQRGGTNVPFTRQDQRRRVWVPDLRPDRCRVRASVRDDKGMGIEGSTPCSPSPLPCRHRLMPA